MPTFYGLAARSQVESAQRPLRARDRRQTRPSRSPRRGRFYAGHKCLPVAAGSRALRRHEFAYEDVASVVGVREHPDAGDGHDPAALPSGEQAVASRPHLREKLHAALFGRVAVRLADDEERLRALGLRPQLRYPNIVSLLDPAKPITHCVGFAGTHRSRAHEGEETHTEASRERHVGWRDPRVRSLAFEGPAF